MMPVRVILVPCALLLAPCACFTTAPPARASRAPPRASASDVPPPPAGLGLSLGLDLSTQSLTLVVLDEALELVYRDVVNFDAELPRFETSKGMHARGGGVVTSPVLMWLEALELGLGRLALAERGTLVRGVGAVSASAQQHGSVYWARGGLARLARARPDAPFAAALGLEAFAVADSPIWADSSTADECAALEAALGGAAATATLTGSRAYERFTGPQIAKAARAMGARAWEEGVERVDLVSSFVATLLRGAPAPLDAADGAGTNLMDLRARAWDARALAATGAPSLARKLARLPADLAAPPTAVLGRASDALVARFGFDARCVVVGASGDNPCTCAGLALAPPGRAGGFGGGGARGDVALSLGTSDTLLGVTLDPSPQLEGHVMPSATDPGACFAMLCYANGGVAREQARETDDARERRARAGVSPSRTKLRPPISSLSPQGARRVREERGRLGRVRRARERGAARQRRPARAAARARRGESERVPSARSERYLRARNVPSR